MPGIIDDIQVNTVETKLIRRNLDEYNPGQENQKLTNIEDDVLANKNNQSTVVSKVMKLKLKPPTRKDMKITRRKNSVMAKVPDKNQIKITTMFIKPTQRNYKRTSWAALESNSLLSWNFGSEKFLGRKKFWVQ